MAAIEQSARRARLPVGGRRRDEPARPATTATSASPPASWRCSNCSPAGWTNKQIAEALFISEKTARVHVSHLLTKLGVPTRGAAVDVAHRHGLLDRR